MVYHGRIVVAGMTPSGKPAAAYAISGRRPSSQKRKFVYAEAEGLLGLVNVGPVGQMSPEQAANAALIFYNAMREREDGVLIVTNGTQTDVREKDGNPMTNFYAGFPDFPDGDNRKQAARIMHAWGYENDPPILTPRIALVMNPYLPALFSIATFDEADKGKDVVASAFETQLSAGEYRGLATYQGLDDEARAWRAGLVEDTRRFLVDVPLTGETPEELAEQLFAWMDPRFVVSTAGAVYDRVWDIAVRNRFETEDDFNRYAAETGK